MPIETTRELHPIVALIFSFFGLGALVANSPKMTNRQLTFAAICAVVFALLVPEIAVPAIVNYAPWSWVKQVPVLALAGLTGFLSGALGGKVVAALMVAGDSLPFFATRWLGRSGREDQK
jgi:peptidoglycan/LPS O-acetylase OafA/YrhL